MRDHFVAADELVTFFAEIETRFHARDQVEEDRPDRRSRPAEVSIQIRERQLRLKRGAGVDQVCDRLRLHEIELAVQHRALGELTRLRETRPECERLRDDQLHEQRISVQRQLDEIIPCERGRGGITHRDRIIDRFTVATPQRNQRCSPRLRRRPPCQRRENARRVRPVDPDDRQRSPPRGRSGSDDRVERFHGS
jgi:hypothetical protein